MKDMPGLEDRAAAAALQKEAKQDAATEAEQRRERGRQEQIKKLCGRADDAGTAASKKADHRRKQEHDMRVKSLLERQNYAGVAALQKHVEDEVASAIDVAAVAQAAQGTAERRGR